MPYEWRKSTLVPMFKIKSVQFFADVKRGKSFVQLKQG